MRARRERGGRGKGRGGREGKRKRRRREMRRKERNERGRGRYTCHTPAHSIPPLSSILPSSFPLSPFPLFSPTHTHLPCTGVPDFPHVGEDDMVLPLVQNSPPLGQPRIHTRVLHKVTDENIETPEVRCLGGDHFKHCLRGWQYV